VVRYLLKPPEVPRGVLTTMKKLTIAGRHKAVWIEHQVPVRARHVCRHARCDEAIFSGVEGPGPDPASGGATTHVCTVLSVIPRTRSNEASVTVTRPKVHRTVPVPAYLELQRDSLHLIVAKCAPCSEYYLPVARSDGASVTLPQAGRSRVLDVGGTATHADRKQRVALHRQR
jgi:hypothetical protein